MVQGATEVETASGPSVYLRKEVQENGEVFLYCHSEQREEKERAMQESSDQKFTTQLERLQAGLSQPHRIKRLDKVHQIIGRLKQQYSAAGQHDDIQVITDDQNPPNAKDIIWNHHPKPGSKATHPGVYCLRTNQDQWDESTLWKTYVTLTDLEAVFRSLKSELGLRPSYHQTSRRAKGHLFLSVLAYQLVQTIRTRLRAKGITDNWNTIRDRLNDHKRVTGVYRPESMARPFTCAEPFPRNRSSGKSMKLWALIPPQGECVNPRLSLRLNSQNDGNVVPYDF